MIRRLILSSLFVTALLALALWGLRKTPRAADAWQPTASPVPSPTAFVEPEGCWEPPDDYTLLWVNGIQRPHRRHARSRPGTVCRQWDSTGWRSRRATGGALAASFGNDGSGAVDLSVRSTSTVRAEDEIEPMLRAARRGVRGLAARGRVCIPAR